MNRTPTRIETEQLSLTPVSPRDEPMLLAIFRDAEVRRYLLDGTLVDADWVHAEVEASRARFSDGSLGIWLATARDGGAAVGFTGFRPAGKPPVLELLYGLLPAFWGRGFAIEMARAMVARAFAAGHNVVRAAVDAPNIASIRVLENLGMTVERRSQRAFGEMRHYQLARPRPTPRSAMSSRFMKTTRRPPVIPR